MCKGRLLMLALFCALATPLFAQVVVPNPEAELWGTTPRGGVHSNGSVYKIDCSGHYSIVYDFPNQVNGRFPNSQVMQHSNGLVYGVTQQGGSDNKGVIFQIDPGTGVYTKIFDFVTSTGFNPNGSLLEGPNGNLYGLTWTGGGGSGTLYEFNPSTHAFTVHKALVGNPFNDPGRNPQGTPILASNGKMYGTTEHGGVNGGGLGAGVLFEFDPATNQYTPKITFLNFDPSGGGYPYTGIHPYADLLEASDGKLYGVAGTNSTVGVLYQYDIATNTAVTKHEFPTTVGGMFNPVDGLNLFGALIEDNGKLYGLASNGGATNWGTLFVYDLATEEFTKTDFLGTGSSGSRGSLVKLASGKMYGQSGSVPGTIFEYDPVANTITTVFTLNENTDAGSSYGKLVKIRRKNPIVFDAVGVKTYGDPEFDLSASTVSGPDIVFESSDPAIASVSGKTVTIHNAGTVTFLASEEGNCRYHPGTELQTVTIEKATLVATADDQSRPYFDPDPAFTITYSGFVNGDDGSDINTPPVTSTTAGQGSNVGTYPIMLTDGDADNYSFSYVYGTLTITKVPVTIRADDKSRIYTSENPPLTFTATGFVNNETADVIDTPPVLSTTRVLGSDVGQYPITASGAVDNNYSFVYVDGIFTVNKALLTAMTGHYTKSYYDDNPVIEIFYMGLMPGETAAVLDMPATATTLATKFSDAGVYEIVLANGSDNNYDFQYRHGEVRILKLRLTIKADDKTKFYSEPVPPLTVTYTGFAGSEDESVLDVAPVPFVNADATTNAGIRVITLSEASDVNYIITRQPGILYIERVPLTIKADDQSRVYYSDNPPLTFTYSGFVMGEDQSVLESIPTTSTIAEVSSDAGEYPIEVSSQWDDNNYELIHVNGTLTITKKEITVTANDMSRPYGYDNPEFTVTYDGLMGSDSPGDIDLPPSGHSPASRFSELGAYDIFLSQGVDNNYTFITVDGTLTIVKAPLIVTADDKTREYGEPNPELTITYEGLVNGDTESVLDVPVTVSTTADEESLPGTYPIVLDGGDNDNHYSISEYRHGTLTVNRLSQTITFPQIPNKTIGDASVPVIASSSSGLAVTVSSANERVKISDGRISFDKPGRETLTAIQLGNQFYLPATASQTFCIKPAKPVITITNQETPAIFLTSSAPVGNQWMLNGEPIAGATSNLLSPSLSGAYTVRVAVDDCESVLSDAANAIVVGDIYEPLVLHYYPNPAMNILYVEGPGEFTFTMSDLTGKNQELFVNKLGGVYQFAVHHLAAGLYILSAADGDRIARIKFLKK